MKAITTGQEEQCIRFITDAARKAAEGTIAELKKNGTLNSGNLQQIIEKGNHVSAEVKKFLKELFIKLAENITGHLKLISGAETLILDSTDGTEMIGKREDVFNGGIDSNFKNYECNIKSQPTNAVNIEVHEMIENGTFQQIYSSQGRELDSLCLTQGQIINFVQKYHNWLCTDGCRTFFLFKVRYHFFVAGVYFDLSGLEVKVRHLSRDNAWLNDYLPRFVFPKLTHGS